MNNKFVQFAIIIFFLLVNGFAGMLVYKSFVSKDEKMANVGLKDGHLMSCGAKPNCVSSTSPTEDSHYFPPLKFPNREETQAYWQKVPDVLQKLKLVHKQVEVDYVHFTAHSPILGFVDDVELQLKADENMILLRSASRVGYSDMGANKKRLQKIVQTLKSIPL